MIDWKYYLIQATLIVLMIANAAIVVLAIWNYYR